MIRIGIFEEPVIDTSVPCELTIDGQLIFKESAFWGKGTRIKVKKGAELVIGHNNTITGNASIACYKSIVLGDECMLSWDILIMDSDTHPIYDNKKQLVNANKPVIIGNKVWIGCRSMILKGSIVPENCIIAAGTVLTAQCNHSLKTNTVIAGMPPMSLKEIASWTKYQI